MIILEDSFNTFIKHDTFIALGNFDGLHLGHRSLINKTIELSNINNAKSMIFTFSNHPLTVINKDFAPKLLMDNTTKLNLFKEMNVDIVNMPLFDEAFMKLSAEEFIHNLVHYYNVRGIVVGFNYRFGYKNLGDIYMLQKLGSELGLNIYTVPAVKYNGDIISSSKIRNLISEEGNIVRANAMLTSPFMLKGKVIKGRQLGRTIDFPTINLDYDKNYVIPRGGVYYTNVKHNGTMFKSITNVGFNPTVHNNKLSVETFVLGFNQDIYDEDVQIYFIKKIRDEKRFNSLQELKWQLLKDRKYVEKQILENKIE